MLNKQPIGDLWHLQDNDPESLHFGRTFHFDFSFICNEELKDVFKDYIWQNWKTGNKRSKKLYNDPGRFHYFSNFAKQHNICSLAELDNA